jgi:hypothetical protein
VYLIKLALSRDKEVFKSPVADITIRIRAAGGDKNAAPYVPGTFFSRKRLPGIVTA